MSDAPVTMDEFDTLQREVAELNESRRRTEKIEANYSEQQHVAEPAVEETENKMNAEENGLHELADQLERYLKEIEDAARERPALTLIAALAVGIVVGRILSRK